MSYTSKSHVPAGTPSLTYTFIENGRTIENTITPDACGVRIWLANRMNTLNRMMTFSAAVAELQNDPEITVLEYVEPAMHLNDIRDAYHDGCITHSEAMHKLVIENGMAAACATALLA